MVRKDHQLHVLYAFLSARIQGIVPWIPPRLKPVIPLVVSIASSFFFMEVHLSYGYRLAFYSP